MGSRILWAVVGGFLLGVFARSFVLLGLWVVAFSLLLAINALLLGFFDRSRLKTFVIICVALVSFAGGIARMHMATLTGDSILTDRINSKVTLEGYVTAEPDARDMGVRISLHVERLILASSTIPVDAGVLASVPAHADVAYGDNVRAVGTLRLPEAFDTGLGRQFRYPEYLAKDGIGYQLAFAQIQKTEGNAGNILKAAAIGVKRAYLEGEAAVLPEPEAGLAGGITVGDKRSIGKELTEDFQRVSLIHMVVLSGYNITIVINAISYILTSLPRFFQFGASGFIVLFFVLMSGGAASAVRAGAMALIAVLARVTGRSYLAGRILGVVAFLMVLWNPYELAFDPSFQLSTLATLGLISFTPMFAARLTWFTEKFGVREIAASTLATQLTVLPLLLYQNGQLSLVALPANLLALLPVPFAMLASFIAAIGGVLFGSYAVPLAFPAYVLLAYIIGIAKFFAALPFAAVSVSAFSAWWLVVAYGALWWLRFHSEKNPQTDS